MLGKYRSLVTEEELGHAIDILENRRFYLAPVSSLNDPLEGRGMVYPINGYAGISIHVNADRLPGPVEDSLKRYRVLCLTADCKSPQMWAHYANGFKGICVCVSQKGLSAEAGEVEYCSQTKNPGVKAIEPDELDSLVRQGLFIKQDGWAYEREYRIVRKFADDAEGSYLTFAEDAIGAVIIGHCAGSREAALIREACERFGIPLYRTYIRDLSRQVDVVPYGFQAVLDARELERQLEDYCAENMIAPFAELEQRF